MRIVLLGKNGQVGWELQRSLAPLGEVIALDRHSQPTADLQDPQALADTLASLQAEVIVNAAAYTAVDKAETEPDLAFLVNAEAPRILAATAQSLGALLVHYSTDYVFNGSGTQAWQENASTGPLNSYGQSKLAGEQAIQASGCQHLIFRTSWVYAARGQNFAKTMLKLAQNREQLSVVADQWGAPTSAELIADITAHAIRQTLLQTDSCGLYHLVASGETTWFDFAQRVLSAAEQHGIVLKTPADCLQAIPSSAYPTPAQRPLNSRLDCNKLSTTFKLNLPDWQFGVDRLLAEILPAYSA